MMEKEIVIVYQDCFTCGSNNWGERTIAHIMSAGVPYRKVSFASAEGQAHCEKAIAQGITHFPFVTDGKTYAYNVENVIQAQSEAHTAKKTTRKTTKKQKGVKNGADTEN